VAKEWSEVVEAEEAPLVASFRCWLVECRGLLESCLYHYCRGAGDLIVVLGDDPTRYNARDLRNYILDRSRQLGPGAAKNLIAAARAFLRYLAAVGECKAGLDRAIPSIAGWRQTSHPHSLSTDDVARTLEACDTQTVVGLRDRAVILLLARLGLRAGDVAALRFSDLDWDDGSLLVAGKSRREVRLPLPQEVGDALLAYVECRHLSAEERVFLRVLPPYHALAPRSISEIVGRAMRRAGVKAHSYGSHILRHSAATEMLRQGASLYEVGAVLRHRSYDQTACYAKVDFSLLKLVAQPWPEVLGC
jgi:site-specific recombinase XerD